MNKLAKLAQNIDLFSHTDMVSNEANTKKKIVEPLLELLGWDLLSNEVRLEQVIRVGTTSGHADYALMLEGKTVVLVEAKAFDVDLSPEHSSQIMGCRRIVEDLCKAKCGKIPEIRAISGNAYSTFLRTTLKV